VSSSEGPPRKKKSRIPGPVGDLLLQDDEGVFAVGAEGKGKAVMSDRDDGDDEAFRSGAWLSALHSLNVEDFDPGRYAILRVTVSRIKASKIQQVQNFVAVIKELTSNVFGDAVVSLKVSISVDLIKHQGNCLSGWEHRNYHFKGFHFSLAFISLLPSLGFLG